MPRWTVWTHAREGDGSGGNAKPVTRARPVRYPMKDRRRGIPHEGRGANREPVLSSPPQGGRQQGQVNLSKPETAVVLVATVQARTRRGRVPGGRLAGLLAFGFAASPAGLYFRSSTNKKPGLLLLWERGSRAWRKYLRGQIYER